MDEVFRAPGYYWVKFEVDTPWEIAELDDGGHWYVVGTDLPFSENTFAAIGAAVVPLGE